MNNIPYQSQSTLKAMFTSWYKEHGSSHMSADRMYAFLTAHAEELITLLDLYLNSVYNQDENNRRSEDFQQ